MPGMKWRVVMLVLFMFSLLTGCTIGGGSTPWSRTGRSNCFGQTRHPTGESGLVFFCAESP
jgi:hypothetical protein